MLFRYDDLSRALLEQLFVRDLDDMRRYSRQAPDRERPFPAASSEEDLISEEELIANIPSIFSVMDTRFSRITGVAGL